MSSLVRVNNLAEEIKWPAYAALTPRAVLDRIGIAGDAPADPQDKSRIMIHCPRGTPQMSLRAPVQRVGQDYGLAIDLEDDGVGQVELAFIIVNDLDAPRFNIDRDAGGRNTLFGTASDFRNVEAEVAAMRAGLGPGQVRRGLRCFRDFLARLETLCRKVGFRSISLVPLSYHNAIMYERYGFFYIEGKDLMEQINAGFQPGGQYAARLDGSSPFREPHLADTPIGRSWAIRDGILGRDLPPMKLCKVVGQMHGVSTFSAPPPSSQVVKSETGSAPRIVESAR